MEETAENWLKKMYGGAAADYVSIEEIFVNTGREGKSAAVNKGWLYNLMTTLKPFKYFDKEYETLNGSRVTKGIRLTAKGRQVLSKPHDAKMSVHTLQPVREVSFATVRQDVRVLRMKYPEFSIVFDARLRDEDDE